MSKRFRVTGNNKDVRDEVADEVSCETVYDVAAKENYYWFLFGSVGLYLFGNLRDNILSLFETVEVNGNARNRDITWDYYKNNELWNVMYDSNDPRREILKRRLELLITAFNDAKQDDGTLLKNSFPSCYHLLNAIVKGNVGIPFVDFLMNDEYLDMDSTYVPSFGNIDVRVAEFAYSDLFPTTSPHTGITFFYFLLYIYYSISPYIMISVNDKNGINNLIGKFNSSNVIKNKEIILNINRQNIGDYYASNMNNIPNVSYSAEVCHPINRLYNFELNYRKDFLASGYSDLSVFNKLNIIVYRLVFNGQPVPANLESDFNNYHYFNLFNLKYCDRLSEILNYVYGEFPESKEKLTEQEPTSDIKSTADNDYKKTIQIVNYGNPPMDLNAMFVLFFSSNPTACYYILCGFLKTNMDSVSKFVPLESANLVTFFESTLLHTTQKIMMFNLLLTYNYTLITNKFNALDIVNRAVLPT